MIPFWMAVVLSFLFCCAVMFVILQFRRLHLKDKTKQGGKEGNIKYFCILSGFPAYKALQLLDEWEGDPLHKHQKEFLFKEFCYSQVPLEWRDKACRIVKHTSAQLIISNSLSFDFASLYSKEFHNRPDVVICHVGSLKDSVEILRQQGHVQ